MHQPREPERRAHGPAPRGGGDFRNRAPVRRRDVEGAARARRQDRQHRRGDIVLVDELHRRVAAVDQDQHRQPEDEPVEVVVHARTADDRRAHAAHGDRGVPLRELPGHVLALDLFGCVLKRRRAQRPRFLDRHRVVRPGAVRGRAGDEHHPLRAAARRCVEQIAAAPDVDPAHPPPVVYRGHHVGRVDYRVRPELAQSVTERRAHDVQLHEAVGRSLRRRGWKDVEPQDLHVAAPLPQVPDQCPAQVAGAAGDRNAFQVGTEPCFGVRTKTRGRPNKVAGKDRKFAQLM